MKRLLLAAICLAAGSLGTTYAQRYTVRGTVPASENGKMVYMSTYEQQEPLDSAVVRDGKFEFTREDRGIRRLELGRKYYANLIAEPGTITVDLSDPKLVGGTPLNDSIAWFNGQKASINKEFDRIQRDSTLTAEEKRARGKELDSRYERMTRASFQANRDNWFGGFVFWDSAFGMNTAEFWACYDAAGEEIREFAPLKHIKKYKEAMQATEAGKKFVDFEGVDSTGRKVKLSDYVGKGKYVLVDFWASWCGPCRQETPIVARAYEKYKDKGLEVLGLFVWDRPKNLGKAVRELKITWPQLIDSNGVAGKLYGVQGIPHIMLIGPDGTILARQLRGPRIEEELARQIN